MELTPGSVLAGRYEILEELGRGGMGRVYRALDREIHEEVALKLLRPETAARPVTITRFRNELKLARRISHRNVCRVYHLGEDRGLYYITMEYVPGEDLKSLLRRTGALDSATAVSMVKQVCEGLAEAHRLGVIHRDLKPQNLLIDRQGNLRILDFGIARHIEAEGMTATGLLIGTPEYMSPEQVEGRDTDTRSDIYSLGVILFEMTTGRVPFEGSTPLSVAVKHETEIAPDPRSIHARIPDDLSRLILKCLEKNPERRPQSVEELLADLEAVETHTTSAATHRRGAATRFVEPPGMERKRPVFVAREEELSKLDAFLNQTVAGHGRVTFITGDVGSGKTALMSEFARRAEDLHQDLVVASGKCDAQTGIGDPYVPFREALDLLSGDIEAFRDAGAMTEERAWRLESLMPHTVRAMLETGQDLIGTFVTGAALLSRATASVAPQTDWLEKLRELVERKRAIPADSTLQQSSLFEQATRVLQALARSRPLVLVLDDLQWADSGSINLLFHLGRRIGGSRLLVVGAYRPTEVALGREGGRHPLEPVVNELRRDFGDLLVELDRATDRRFLDAFLDSQPNLLSGRFRDRLFRQTGGQPLFTIELLRSMQDQGLLVQNDQGQWIEGSGLDWDRVPARVEAVIEERIGRLPPGLRETLTFASVEGEEFTAEVVARVLETDPRQLVRLLSSELEKKHHLVSARGVVRVNGTCLSRYTFQHILFQKHLYDDLDDVERFHIHEAVGNILEDLYGERVDEIAVQLARHFGEAGVADKAIDYLHRAGQRAVRVSANEEAISHFTKALERLDRLPDGTARTRKELTLQLALAAPLQAARGFAAPELGRAVVRARELCQRTRDVGQLFTALAQLALFYATRPEYRTALELQDQLRSLAAQLDDPMFTAIPYYVQTWPLLNLGEIVQASEDAEQALVSYDPTHHGVLAYIYGFDLGVMNLGFGAWCDWFLGYPERARRKMERALALARELDHPHTLAFALVCACELAWFLRDRQEVDRYTEELVPIAEDRGFVYWQAHGTFYQGERRALQGQIQDGIAQMHQAIMAMRATGTETCLTRLYTRMADACGRVGEVEEGLRVVAAAMEIMEKYDERYMEAELYRHRGELLLRQDQDPAQTESDYVLAIETAQRQRAKSLELRASMSQARLWQSQGKTQEARERLAAIHRWFTEGYETADLMEAKALLEQL